MLRASPVKLPNYSPVGIGNLHYSGEFVEEGPPHPLLKGDIKFTSTRQGLVCSPRHVQHPWEKKIFNDFMETHPNPSTKDWIELAKLFKEKTDYINIFPKLPSMLRTYYKRWRDSQSIVLAEMQVKGKYSDLLFALALPVSRSSIPAVAQQVEHSRYLPSSSGMQRAIHNPPLAALGQQEFVGSRVQCTNRTRRRCSNALFGCTFFADECNGYRSELCRELIAGRISLPATDDDRKVQRAESNKEKKRKAMAARRQKEKAAKQAAEDNN